MKQYIFEGLMLAAKAYKRGDVKLASRQASEAAKELLIEQLSDERDQMRREMAINDLLEIRRSGL